MSGCSRNGEELPATSSREAGAVLEEDGIATPAGEALRRTKMLDDQGDLGDIDVLGIDEPTKTLWSIECKNIRGSNAVGVASGWCRWAPSGNGIVARHASRCWLAANKATVNCARIDGQRLAGKS
jgi:hypothetical protein